MNEVKLLMHKLVAGTWVPVTDEDFQQNLTYSFTDITGKPTTLSGYGITDAATVSHTHTFSSLTSKPTTLSGYGITDAANLAGGNTFTGNQIFSSNVTVSGNFTQGSGTNFSSGAVNVTLTAASVWRNALGLGTLATQSGTFSGTSSGTNTGDQDLSGKANLTGGNTFTGTQSITGNVNVNGQIAVQTLVAITSSQFAGELVFDDETLFDYEGVSAATHRAALGVPSGSGSSTGTNTGDQTTITGNAGSATVLQTGRTISITGDIAYTSASFNGSANVTGTGTLASVNSNVGQHGSSTSIPQIIVDAKGRITSVSGQSVIAPAGTLTGTTLASNVINSSITSLGNLTGLNVLGNTVLGDGTGNTIIFNGRVASHIVSTTNNTYDLGSTSLRYKDGWFAGNLTIGTALSVGGAATLSGGVDIVSGLASPGSIKVGADVNALTRSTNVRKFASFTCPDYTNAKNIEFFNLDSPASNSNLLNIGGRPGGSQYAATYIQFVTAPDTSTTGGTARLTIDAAGQVSVTATTASTTTTTGALIVAGGVGVAGRLNVGGQTELTSQAATNGTSVMTRDLVDARISGPKFFAKCSAVQSVPDSTNTKLNFASEDWDTAGAYDTATSRFTPLKAGYYQINISVRAATNANSTQVILFKNGAVHRYLVQANNHGFITFCASALVSMNGTTDYVEVYLWHNKGSALDIGTSDGTHTQFSAAYIH